MSMNVSNAANFKPFYNNTQNPYYPVHNKYVYKNRQQPPTGQPKDSNPSSQIKKKRDYFDLGSSDFPPHSGDIRKFQEKEQSFSLYSYDFLSFPQDVTKSENQTEALDTVDLKSKHEPFISKKSDPKQDASKPKIPEGSKYTLDDYKGLFLEFKNKAIHQDLLKANPEVDLKQDLLNQFKLDWFFDKKMMLPKETFEETFELDQTYNPALLLPKILNRQFQNKADLQQYNKKLLDAFNVVVDYIKDKLPNNENKISLVEKNLAMLNFENSTNVSFKHIEKQKEDYQKKLTDYTDSQNYLAILNAFNKKYDTTFSLKDVNPDFTRFRFIEQAKHMLFEKAKSKSKSKEGKFSSYLRPSEKDAMLKYFLKEFNKANASSQSIETVKDWLYQHDHPTRTKTLSGEPSKKAQERLEAIKAEKRLQAKK